MKSRMHFGATERLLNNQAAFACAGLPSQGAALVVALLAANSAATLARWQGYSSLILLT